MTAPSDDEPTGPDGAADPAPSDDPCGASGSDGGTAGPGPDDPEREAAADPASVDDPAGTSIPDAGDLRPAAVASTPDAPGSPPAAVGVRAALRRPRVLAGVAAGTALAGLLGWLVVDRVTGLPEDAALRVGDTVVTEAQFRQQLDLMEGLYGVHPPADDADRDRFERDAAQATAVGIVVNQEARQRGIVVSRAETDAALRTLVDERFGGREAFLRGLVRLGVSERDVVREVRRRLTKTRLFAQVVAGVPAVTEAEARRAYEDRRPLSPERRRLHNIVVESEARATEVLDKARAGADFAALAVQYSRDDATRATGGDLGDLSRDQLEQPYGDAAFTAGVGELFGPVRTSRGWNVGQVVAVQSAVPLTFEEVAAELRTALRTEREAAAWHAFLVERVRAADVEYAERYRPADPEAIPAASR